MEGVFREITAGPIKGLFLSMADGYCEQWAKDESDSEFFQALVH
jgi:hypothetical protein